MENLLLEKENLSNYVIVIVIVNSRFLELPQKRSRRNKLIHRRYAFRYFEPLEFFENRSYVMIFVVLVTAGARAL